MKKLVVGNLKMNILNPAELERYFKLFRREIIGKKMPDTEIVLCPPYLYLENFVKNLKSKKVSIGAQNTFWEKEGSFTGEISPFMIRGLGAQYVIVGHSERRRYFGENNETVNLKLKSAIKAGLHSIYCVGETIEERRIGHMSNIITKQIQEGLADISSSQMEKIVIAYEPVWSVGSDVIPTSNEIMEAKILIRKILTEKYGAKNAQSVRILYGGSVNDKTVEQTCVDPGMDGALIGRESLAPHELIKIASIISGTNSL